jgi:hypothetical protein
MEQRRRGKVMKVDECNCVGVCMVVGSMSL